MSINSQNVSGRRAKAIALIKSGLIHSQSDLVLHLKKSGFRVTQATASRDLEEIGAVRGRNGDGVSVYQIRESADDALSRVMCGQESLGSRLLRKEQGKIEINSDE